MPTHYPAVPQWYVITGGPSSGKSTLVELLRAKGYRTTIEEARHLIDLQRIIGRSTDEVRANQALFQREVYRRQIEQEDALNPNETVFLDRALPDSLAYYRFLGLQPDSDLLHSIEAHHTYRKVFILDLLPLHPDYARTEDTAAQHRIHELLLEVYSSLNIPLERVPVLSVEQRAEYVLDRL
ncbi:MAG: AAA family ATPase [Agromyces sp.]